MNIAQLIEKVKTDEEFSAKYAALKSAEAIIEQAKSDGYNITKEEVEATMRVMVQKSGELSEEDLALVAGGEGTKNNYSETDCADRKYPINGICINGAWAVWCDHLRRSDFKEYTDVARIQGWEFWCVKGFFHVSAQNSLCSNSNAIWDEKTGKRIR